MAVLSHRGFRRYRASVRGRVPPQPCRRLLPNHFSQTRDMTDVKGYVLRPGEGVPGFDGSVKAGRVSTGGSLCVIESTTRGGAPRHVHAVDDEAFYVLEGTLSVECGGDVWEAGPRCFVFLPHGVPHAWDVV